MDLKITPLIVLRGLVIFPGTTISFDVARDKSVNALKSSMENGRTVLLCAQKNTEITNPGQDDIYAVGTYCEIKQVFQTSSDTYNISVLGIQKGEIISFEDCKDYFLVTSAPANGYVYNEQDMEIIALKRKIRTLVMNAYALNSSISSKLIRDVMNTDTLSDLINTVAGNFQFEYNELQAILEELDIKEASCRLIKLLNDEIEILKIDQQISSETKSSIDKSQREYYLREQLKTIKENLDEGDTQNDEIEEYRNKILSLELSSDSEEKLIKELSKLNRLAPSSPEAAVITMYLDTVLDLPWNIKTKETVDVKEAHRILERDHYGLAKVKERILEFFAVKELGGKTNGNIICLSGPPGVGKTSIAKSLAEALNRNYVRISLGGVKDESEIRGHRKTYLGSMPGRIISALTQAKSSNPLILLDEIDKMSSDYKGDPASAMLEVLDYEQNNEFKDNYIEIPFDLSDVLFITTANDVYSIPDPLRDRMEIIEVDGYTPDEKFEIAKRHLIPKQLKRHNLSGVVFNDDAVNLVIENYTRESGVRTLDRLIAKICRKVAMIYINENVNTNEINKESVKKLLGNEKFRSTYADNEPSVGIANGLAWTGYGGDVLNIEVSVMPGSGKTILTGNLGDVMKESATTAISYIRSNCDSFGVNPKFAEENDIHVHVPEGSVPKDGPSAGITLTTAIVSALTDRPIKPNIAMTGEITLRGKVLPIGGLKEKTLAALRYGVDTIIIPEDNKNDADELSDYVKEGLKIIPVKNYNQVANNVFVN